MKTFYTLVLLMFLVSCGTENVVDESSTSNIPATEQVAQGIDEATANLPEEDIVVEAEEASTEDGNPDEQAAASSEVVELSTTYNNPKMEVVMNIEYDLADDGTISEISVTSPNYGGMPEFNS